jgi:hypothetical protein
VEQTKERGEDRNKIHRKNKEIRRTNKRKNLKIGRNKTERKNERRTTNEIKRSKMGQKKTEKKKYILMQEEKQERGEI